MASHLPTLLFIGLVIFLLGFLAICIKKCRLSITILLSAIVLWLCLTASLSLSGFFMNFNALPPRIFFAIFPITLLLIAIALSSKATLYLAAIPQTWLINIQAFRVVMEIVLWLLASQHVIPEIMTWNGRNFDILIGATAPFVAYAYSASKDWGRKVAIIWNVLGILLLINVFIHGLLSAPTPFRVFFTTPANTFVGSFPYIWLPAFVVPCAVLFHILSLRKE